MVDAPSSQPGGPTERLQEIQQRLEAATPGPWEARADTDNHERKNPSRRRSVLNVDRMGGPNFHLCRVWEDGPHPERDAELIAHAPGDLSYLLGEVVLLRQQNAELRAALRAPSSPPPPATPPEEASALRRSVLEEVVAMERLAETRGLRLSGVYSAATMLLGEMEVDEGRYRPASEVFAALRSKISSGGGEGNPMPDTHTPGDLYPKPPNTGVSPPESEKPR